MNRVSPHRHQGWAARPRPPYSFLYRRPADRRYGCDFADHAGFPAASRDPAAVHALVDCGLAANRLPAALHPSVAGCGSAVGGVSGRPETRAQPVHS